MNKKLLNDLKKKIHQIFNKFDANLIQSCDFFKNFTGRDIDAFYEYNSNKKLSNNIDTIIRSRNNHAMRFHLNQKNNIDFLSLDIEDFSSMHIPFKLEFEKNFNKKIYCKKTKLYHFDEKSIIFYKLYKYFFNTIHSMDQLKILKNKISKLKEKDFFLIVKSVDKTLPNEAHIIKKFLFWDFKKFSTNKNTIKFFLEKKNKRDKKREIFAGKLSFKNIFFSEKFIYAFLFGSSAKWKSSHNAMPAIAIVGNDGSGKTTMVEYIRNNFSKMDPLIFDMKASNPLFSISLKLRKILIKIKKEKKFKKLFFLKMILYVGELLDFFDTYIKYRIGIAWADSGKGLTIFERYPTDRIRGEFPNNKNKFFPLEQYFPMPDGIIYLDVSPKNTLLRKKKDKHTISEMISKRKNYLSLLKEIDEVKILPKTNDIKKNIIQIKDYIFYINFKKKKHIFKYKKIKRIRWNKNFNRKLAGKPEERLQKNRFL